MLALSLEGVALRYLAASIAAGAAAVLFITPVRLAVRLGWVLVLAPVSAVAIWLIAFTLQQYAHP
jgi:hypothetical protein